MTEHDTITARLREHATWLTTLRVSQDGWAKVLERIAQDTADLTDALEAGKIVAHTPEHLKKQRLCKQ